MVSFLQASKQNNLCISLLFHDSNMPRPSHSPFNIRRGVRIIKLLVICASEKEKQGLAVDYIRCQNELHAKLLISLGRNFGSCSCKSDVSRLFPLKIVTILRNIAYFLL